MNRLGYFCMESVFRKDLYICRWLSYVKTQRKPMKRVPISSSPNNNVPSSLLDEKANNYDVKEYNLDDIKVSDSNRLSNRMRFRRTPVNSKIITQLDSLKLGYLGVKRNDSRSPSKINPLERKLRQREVVESKPERPLLFRKEGTSIQSIAWSKDLPSLTFQDNPPEVAIIGRSNVGKSSLLNRLLGYNSSFVQKSMVSDKPGETKELKFYGLRMKKDVKLNATEKSSRPWSLVITDMPGYGFAYWNEEDRARCMDLCRDYLLHRDQQRLKRVLLLLDARHGFKLGDKEFFRDLLGQSDSSSSKRKLQVSWKLQIILTKCDLIDRYTLAKRIADVESKLADMLPAVPANMLQIMPISSIENKGILPLQKELASLVPRQPDDFIPSPEAKTAVIPRSRVSSQSPRRIPAKRARPTTGKNTSPQQQQQTKKKVMNRSFIRSHR
jgi:GTP-binding protein EngB required for normal cell division